MGSKLELLIGNLSPLLFRGKRFKEVFLDGLICRLSSFISKSEKNLDKIPHPELDAPPHIQSSLILWIVMPCFFIGLSIIFLTTIVVPKTVRPFSLPKPAAIKPALESVVPEININFYSI